MSYYTYLFSYQENRTFSKFELSKHTLYPDFVGRFHGVQQTYLKKDLDDLFNILYEPVFKDNSTNLAKNLQLLYIMRLFSDPLFILQTFQLVNPLQEIYDAATVGDNFAVTLGVIGKLGLPEKLQKQVNEIIQKLPRNFKQSTSNKMFFKGNELTTDEVVKDFQTRTEFKMRSTFEVDSKFKQSQFYKNMYNVYGQYVKDVASIGNLNQIVGEVYENLRWSFDWYFSGDIKKSPNTILYRNISDILINRTYTLDHYETIKKTYTTIEPDLLKNRYNVAIIGLSNEKPNTVLEKKHYLNYVSFWDKANTILTLFTKVKFKDTIEIYDEREKIVEFCILCTMVLMIPLSQLDLFTIFVEYLDKSNDLEPREKLKSLEGILAGFLYISRTEPVQSQNFNSTGYPLLVIVFQCMACWFLSDTFWSEKATGSQLFLSKKEFIGDFIRYVPIPIFPEIFQIYLEDEWNKTGVDEVLKKFNKEYTKEKLNLDLYNQDIIKKPIKFKDVTRDVDHLKLKTEMIYFVQYYNSIQNTVKDFARYVPLLLEFIIGMNHDSIGKVAKEIITIHYYKETREELPPVTTLDLISDDMKKKFSKIKKLNDSYVHADIVTKSTKTKMDIVNIYNIFIMDSGDAMENLIYFDQMDDAVMRDLRNDLGSINDIDFKKLSVLRTLSTYFVMCMKTLSQKMLESWDKVRIILQGVGLTDSPLKPTTNNYLMKWMKLSNEVDHQVRTVYKYLCTMFHSKYENNQYSMKNYDSFKTDPTIHEKLKKLIPVLPFIVTVIK